MKKIDKVIQSDIFSRTDKYQQSCNKPEAEMESMVCYHLYWLITGSNNVWTVDKNINNNESLLNLNQTFKNAEKNMLNLFQTVWHLAFFLQVGGEVEEFMCLQVGAAFTVMWSLDWSVMVKKELGRKANICIHHSI